MSKSSSNNRESWNLFKSVEDVVRYGQFKNAKLFLLNKKSVTEGTYYRVISNKNVLFQIVLIVQKFEMEGTLRIQVIHVAGTHMIIIQMGFQ